MGKKNARRKVSRLWIIVIASLVLFIALSAISVFIKKDKNKKTINQTKSLPNNTSILESKDTNKIIKENGETVKAYQQELRTSSSEKWDKLKIDKVYLSLIYADKVGSFNDVFAMLTFLDAAKLSGYNIDDNSYGYTQKNRDEVRQRAEGLSNSLGNLKIQ